MRKQTRASRRSQKNSQVFSLALIGSGLALFGILGFFLLPRSSAQTSEQEPSVIPVPANYPAPELDLSDLAGNPVSLSDYQGQVVLVNNWATWCPPCKAEMPVLQAFYEAHKDQGFTIIAIESGEPAEVVAQFVEDHRLSFPVWPDIKSVALTAFRNLSLPSSYVIDRDGQVRLAWTGAVSRETLEKYVTPMIQE
jgi:peroxiredoxin